MENNIEYDMERTCRSCLAHSNELTSLFNAAENIDSSTALVEIIMECTQVKIAKDDGMPCKICNNCTKDVQNAYAYKKKCQESDMKLRKYLSKKCLNVRIKIEDDVFCELKTENPTDEDPLNEQFVKNVKSYKETLDSDEDYNMDGDDPKDSDYEYDPKEDLPETSKKSNNGRVICHICGKALADKRSLKCHVRLHTGKNLKRCKTCGKGFSKKNHLDRHMTSHLKKEYSCDQCDEKFDTHYERRLHKNIHNTTAKKRGRRSKKIKEEEVPINPFLALASSNGTKLCTCKICNQTFSRIYSLRKHLTWHMEDMESFRDIDLKTHADLFDHDVSTESDEFLINHIQQLIKSNDSQRFYQILNDNALEMTISDSETESETEFLNPDWKPKKPSYSCSKCDKLFDRKYKTMLHMKQEHDECEFVDKCLTCDNFFPNTDIYTIHRKTHCENQAKQISCATCKMKFMWKDSLDAHTEKLHSKNLQASAAEEKPSPVSSRASRIKEKTFICDMCPKAFFRAEHLDRHRKVHMPAEKKFICDICKKKFNRKDNLKSHMRVHKQEKEVTDKHLCVYCGRSFSNSSNLIVHMRRHTGEKPYKCDFCDKGFPRSSDLQCHRRTHTGEKPCLCTICGKGFSRSNKLVRHMRIHTGVRPYKCPYCERAFTQSNDLTLHIRRHTGDKPYVCGVCGDRFIQGTALQTHRRVQGHFEDSQPTPFASISAHNPSRYTNANRVNRIGVVPLETIVKQEAKSTPINTLSAKSEPENITVTQGVQGTIPATSSVPTQPNHISNSALRMPNFPITPSPYVPNGNPFLMQNLEMPSMFSIPPFSQNYN